MFQLNARLASMLNLKHVSRISEWALKSNQPKTRSINIGRSTLIFLPLSKWHREPTKPLQVAEEKVKLIEGKSDLGQCYMAALTSARGYPLSVLNRISHLVKSQTVESARTTKLTVWDVIMHCNSAEALQVIDD